MPAVAFIFIKAGRAAKVFWILLTDRATARRLPWRYIRQRLVRSPVCIVQWVGILGAVVLWPVGAGLSEPMKSGLILTGVGLWVIGLMIPVFARAWHRHTKYRVSSSAGRR